MRTSVIRRIVFCLIAMWAFGQAAVALAACSMERGAPMQIAQADGTCECGDEGQSAMQSANVCASHCTADLQLPGTAPVLVRAPADAPVLRVAQSERHSIERTALEAPPPRALPHRILQHAFLI